MDLFDAVAFHQLALQAAGRSPHTMTQARYYQRLFLRYLHEHNIEHTLSALTPANARAALLWYVNSPWTQRGGNRSRNREVAARAFIDLLKRWAAFLEDEGIVEDSPLRKLKRVTVARHMREPFGEAEIQALWEASRKTRWAHRDEAIFLVLLDTGMRIGELCSIRLGRLHFEEQRVIVGAEGKGRRDRVVPLGERALRAVRNYLDSRPNLEAAGDSLFLDRYGWPITASGGHDLISRLGKVAGVEKAYPHRLRHTFCTHYLTVFPGDELGLRRIVGHISRAVLSDYVHLAETTIAQRAARAAPSGSLTVPTNPHRVYGHRNWRAS